MTIAAEFQAKVTKAAVNMDRLDGIVNGADTFDQSVDGSRSVPSLAKLAKNFKGWSPIFSVETDGARSVLQIADWTGGPSGTTKPATGGYIGPDGIVSSISAAVNIRGPNGADGQSFTVNASGNLVDRATYDSQPPPFSFVAIDEGKLYFRTGSAGNWTAGVPFGKGDAGKQVEFQKSSTYIQWRYVGDATWTNLVALSDLKDQITAGNIATALGYTAASAEAMALPSGPALIGYAVNDPNAATRTAESKLRERISVSDFAGPTDSIRLQRAINFASARGGLWDVQIDAALTVGGVDSAPNVRLMGGKLTAIGGADRIINIAAASHHFVIDGVLFDALALDHSGGFNGAAACIYQNPGVSRSIGLRIVNNRFAVRNNNGQAYCTLLMNDSSGECAGNYTSQCGGDIYNFNGGFWNVHHNVAMNGGDGGIAMNNGVSGRVDSNYVYKCSLGTGTGPTGSTAAPFTNVEIVNNVFEACDWGVAAGWFAVPGGREGPQYAKISGNKIIKPRSWGIRFDGRSSTPYMDLQITDNQVILSGASDYSGSAGTGHGIGVVNASGSVVQDNHVVGGIGDAFFFDGTNNDLVFDGNVARANGGYGVRWQGTNTVHMGSFREIGNTSGGSIGTPTIVSGQIEYTGTSNGSGTITIAHNLGATALKRVVPGSIAALVQDASGAEFPMTLSYIDGTNMQFTSAIASRPVVAQLRLRERTYSNL